MRASQRRLVPAVVACVLLLGAADKADDLKVELRVVKYEEVGELIKSLKGKIVIVDFWADT
jgi:hypothetical protein